MALDGNRNSVLKLRPPVIAAAYLVVSLMAHWVTRRHIAFHIQSSLGGAILILVGFSLIVWAWSLFRKESTTIRPTENPSSMVIRGPYRFTRNPMYLGVTIMLTAIALLVGGLPLFFAPVAFLLTINCVFVPHEERVLEQTFGQSYLDYKKLVRRWL